LQRANGLIAGSIQPEYASHSAWIRIVPYFFSRQKPFSAVSVSQNAKIVCPKNRKTIRISMQESARRSKKKPQKFGTLHFFAYICRREPTTNRL
jgi:hypothetical protein